jgi:glycosyltransferase involved in cell wall biosynthesis
VKVLLSALACEPGKGSELEVGYRAMLAAAHRHEVWVLTNADTLPSVAAAVAGTEAAARIHLVGIEFGLDEKTFARLTVSGFHRYYDRWQRRAADRARELDRELDFDLVHHVTLATYWTRAGAATLRKPLVLGPVGGGVETPWRLVPELGWRGLGQDVGRVAVRRVLGRLGPSYRAQRDAKILFAQNAATAARLETRGEVIVLSNATAIDLGPVPACGPRTKDIYLVGRLTAWKAPMLAVRAMRYVQDPDCVLHVCGDGAERRRMERAARRWGVADRVRFDGWLTREALLARLVSAGALIHPALHEEAGLCVAEALSLGTPVVCLDRGGPPALLAEWPETRSEAVRPAGATPTAQALAVAVDKLLAEPPEIRRAALPPRRSFEGELLAAYDRAVATAPARRQHLRPVVWAFPRGKPQVFANSATTIGKGIAVYAFGRQIPQAVQRLAVAQTKLPGLRSIVAERHERPDPVCGWARWHAILDRVAGSSPVPPQDWLHFRSQWAKQRSSALGLDGSGRPLFFVSIEPQDRASVHPEYRGASFRVPARLDSFVRDGWQVRVVEPLPKYHRATRWDPGLIRRVADDIPSALAGLLPRPAAAPAHWIPVHGDFVPWNLRRSAGGQLWLVDWEDACWGPPGADLVRYLVACESLRGSAPEAAAGAARREIDARVDLQDVASFWLGHRNLGAGVGPDQPRGTARDASRGAREIRALRVLAGTDAAGQPDPAVRTSVEDADADRDLRPLRGAD